MNKLIEFEIPSCEDRSELCSILATAGYPVVVENRTDYSRPCWDRSYFVVVVFGKDEKSECKAEG